MQTFLPICLFFISFPLFTFLYDTLLRPASCACTYLMFVSSLISVPPFNSFNIFFRSFLVIFGMCVVRFRNDVMVERAQSEQEKEKERESQSSTPFHCIADEKLLFIQQWWFHCGHKTELERILCSFSCVAVLFISRRLLCHVAHCFWHAVEFHCFVISTILNIYTYL